jgi:Mn2+/Fe2+ NRAMP family transporter
MILASQVINGILLPLILIFMIRLVNDKRIMKDHINSRTYNVVAWASVVILIGLTFAIVGITVREMTR